MATETLYRAIDSTPIIDHHAHNLLHSSALDEPDILSITSEATGPALWHSQSSLAHIRAVRQLSSVLGCRTAWHTVRETLKDQRARPDDAWARRCFEGIETALIDDGLGGFRVHPFDWHDRLTRSPCKRIVRIECIAEALINDALLGEPDSTGATFNPSAVISDFKNAIARALEDPVVAGFKSVICYRTGLAIPKDVHDLSSNAINVLKDLATAEQPVSFARLEHDVLNPFFVHLTAIAIETSQKKKPFQFHTGLGDNDMNLGLSNPSHLQPFIEHYPTVQIVLLHASYPFTAEAGYLAALYANVFLDIGEVFPFISHSGQERVIQEALELCPAAKLTWSTDGHFHPETYLLAVMQVREGLKKVLGDFVRREVLRVDQAISIVEAILFKTSNELYGLNLVLRPIHQSAHVSQHISTDSSADLDQLQKFLGENPGTKFLRMQWVDYTATVRLRVLPVKHALKLCRENKFVGITKAVLGLLQDDTIAPGFDAVGEYNLCPDYTSLRQGSRNGTSTVQCDFRESDNSPVPTCPRTVLRTQIEAAHANNLSLLIGSEIEVVFLPTDLTTAPHPLYPSHPINTGGHAWSSARALHRTNIISMIERILTAFDTAGIAYEQYHPESSPGQYEFVLSPLPPLPAIDTLIAARDIIATLAASISLRATLVPKPFPHHAGTGAHMHLSLSPAHHWPAFYAGVLAHLRAIAAFAYPTDASYERVQDGAWAGGTWVAWGSQNRETPLRRIEGAHFELKCVDGLANPYLFLAAVLAAGVGGVEDGEELRWGDCTVPPERLDEAGRAGLGIEERLPGGFGEAVEALEGDAGLRGRLGEGVCGVFGRVKGVERGLLGGMEGGERRRWLIERY